MKLIQIVNDYNEYQPVIGHSESVILHFHTDSEDVDRGWAMLWNRKCSER